MKRIVTHIAWLGLFLAVVLSSCHRDDTVLSQCQALFHQAEEQYAAKQTNEAAESLGRALLLIENGHPSSEIDLLKAQIKDLLGTVYWKHDLFEEALGLHRQAIETFRQGNDQALLAKALRNAGRVMTSMQQTEEANAYYNEALSLAQQLPDTTFMNEMLLEIANDLYLEGGDYDRAIQTTTLALRNGADNALGNLILGLSYYYLENDSLAIDHLTQSLMSEKHAIRASAYQALYFLSKEKGNFERSLAYYEHYDEEKTLTDQEFRQEEMRRIKSDYDMQLHKLIMDAALKERNMHLYIIMAVFVALLAVMLLLLRQKALRGRLHEEEVKNQLELALKKNKVFVTALALSEQITASTLDFDLSQRDWDDFVELIDMVYGDFTKKLLERYPSLTKRDLQICCLTKQGFGNQVISILMNLQIDSFARQKSRIKRGKMNEPQEERSFEEIINEI